MRGEDDERLAVLAIEMVPAFELDQSANAFLGTPPQDAALEDCPSKGAKVTARKLFPVVVLHLRKAQSQIRAHHAPAFPCDPVDEHAEAVAERRQQAQRQQREQPDQADTD